MVAMIAVCITPIIIGATGERITGPLPHPIGSTSLSTEWFYQAMGDVVGPLNAAELRAHAHSGRIMCDTFVRRGPDGQWLSADRIKGLFDRDSPKLPTPPVPPQLASNSITVTAPNDQGIETDGEEKPVYTMTGFSDVLEVFEDRVTLTPKGVLGFLYKGTQGTKEIPFLSITAIQFKEAGFFVGYLQFTILGGNESEEGGGAALTDENSFTYDSAESNGKAKEIKKFIDQAMRKTRSPQPPANTTSLSDELQKLAALNAQGILSDEEFQSAKRKLIG